MEDCWGGFIMYLCGLFIVNRLVKIVIKVKYVIIVDWVFDEERLYFFFIYCLYDVNIFYEDSGFRI